MLHDREGEGRVGEGELHGRESGRGSATRPREWERECYTAERVGEGVLHGRTNSMNVHNARSLPTLILTPTKPYS